LRVWGRSQKAVERLGGLFPFVSTDEIATAEGADLCVLCTPIGIMESLAQRIAPALSPRTTVTDVGSVKTSVVARLEGVLGRQFVGSHPMAGSEQSGFQAARPDLFGGAICILTPTTASAPQALTAVRELWQSVGCRLVELSPEKHDECIARVSHLPHAVASALVNAINLRVPDAGALAGGGYRDATRIAAGPSAMWREILLENRDRVLAGLDDFLKTIADMKELIAARDSAGLELFLERAKEIRENLP
jgi:prephenate dehydrogenase